MEIISKRRTEEGVEYRLTFNYEGETGWGFSFECDKDGKLLPEAFAFSDARSNYEKCLKGEVDGRKVQAPVIDSYEWRNKIPAVGKCDVCGREVELPGFTNTCECGADYNSAGQRLAPRSQWGEETGETANDILMSEAQDFPELD